MNLLLRRRRTTRAVPISAPYVVSDAANLVYTYAINEPDWYRYPGSDRIYNDDDLMTMMVER